VHRSAARYYCCAPIEKDQRPASIQEHTTRSALKSTRPETNSAVMFVMSVINTKGWIANADPPGKPISSTTAQNMFNLCPMIMRSLITMATKKMPRPFIR
ncbi:hypothetical protein MCOR06_011844, partial [Pyricularia oryzae]